MRFFLIENDTIVEICQIIIYVFFVNFDIICIIEF
jgi:hypothetical protein